MKNKAKILPVVYFFLGICGYACCRWLYGSAVDGADLLIPMSAPELIVWGLTFAVLVSAFVLPHKCSFCAGSSILPGVGDLVFAVAVVCLFMTPVKGPKVLMQLYRIFIGISAAALAASAVSRFWGKKPHFLLMVAPCVLCVLHLVVCYQRWSEIPQLMDYVMGVGAVLGLNLFAYHRMARSAGLPYRGVHYSYGLLGIYFCLCAMHVGDFALFFGGAAVWMTCDQLALCEA